MSQKRAKITAAIQRTWRAKPAPAKTNTMRRRRRRIIQTLFPSIWHLNESGNATRPKRALLLALVLANLTQCRSKPAPWATQVKR